MITLIARYQARPGRGDDVQEILARHVARTRAEPGCVQFFASRSDDAPDQFVLFEQYVDEASLDAHRQTAHFREYIERGVVPLLAERAWQRYQAVEPATV